MSTVELWTTVGLIGSALETFPLWGPVLAVVAAVLLVQATRMTWGTSAEDTDGDGVPPVLLVISPVEDTVETTLNLRRVICGDTVPRMSSTRETGGT